MKMGIVLYFLIALFVCDVGGVTVYRKLEHLQLDVDYLRYQARAFRSELTKLEKAVEENVIKLDTLQPKTPTIEAIDHKIENVNNQLKERLDNAVWQLRELQTSAVKQGPWVSYRNSYYRHFKKGMTKVEAGKHCIKYGASIVVVNDAQEMDFIVQTFGTAYSSWIEGSDEDKEGEWRLPNGQLLTYTNWDENEPNNRAPTENAENCIEGGASGRKKWNNVRCTSYRLSVVCEFTV